MSISCSKFNIPGKYGTNFPTYGMFGKTLTINCDSTAILKFSGDLMNDNSYGKWKLDGDTLTISFDTINYPNSRYRKDLNLRIKRNNLYNIPFTRKQYDDLVNEFRKSGNDSLKIPSYKKLNRKVDKNMTNHKGTMRRQYYKKFEEYKCN